MDYKGKKVIVTGHTGFIGRALADALVAAGAWVFVPTGDVRDTDNFQHLCEYTKLPVARDYVVPVDHSFDYLFHFAAPSSQVLFKRNAAHCIDVTLNGLIQAAKTCRKHGIRLIYPSTGLLSQGRTNEYAMCKKICEDYIAGSGIDALGIRIFATYGPGEGHKADYASVPFLFARDIVKGKRPVIYGDGTQVRDFIYIGDTVYAILHLAEEYFAPIVDLGSGDQVAFNTIVDRINEAVFGSEHNRYIKPEYIPAPGNYVAETHADVSELNKIYRPIFYFDEGIIKLVNSLLGR